MKQLFKFILLPALFVMLAPASVPAAKATVLKSPDGKIAVELKTDKGQLGYTVSRDGKVVYTISDIALKVDKLTLPTGMPKVGKTQHIARSFKPAVPLKFSTINEDFNETTINVGSGTTVLLRVMNNGVAYRFVLAKKGDVEIFDDFYRLTPAKGFTTHRQPAPDNFNTSYEEAYRSGSIADWTASDRKMSTLPMLMSGADDTQLLVGESEITSRYSICRCSPEISPRSSEMRFR